LVLVESAVVGFAQVTVLGAAVTAHCASKFCVVPKRPAAMPPAAGEEARAATPHMRADANRPASMHHRHHDHPRPPRSAETLLTESAGVNRS
jgi:hypothetical protein